MSAQDGLLFDEPEGERYRFLLVIAPALEVEAEVTALKRALRERIGGFSSSNSIPHITLFFADLPAGLEHDVRMGIRRGCEGQRAFALHIRGTTHFPDKRTIYLDPVEKEAIAALRKPIVQHVRAFPAVRRYGVNATDHPHLTIAAGLKPKQFEAIWPKLSALQHDSVTEVRDVLLLKRPLSRPGRYEEVERFPLYSNASR